MEILDPLRLVRLASRGIKDEQIKSIRHRNIPTISEEEGKYLVQFHIEGVRSLIGNE